MKPNMRALLICMGGLAAMVFAGIAEPRPRLVWNGSTSTALGLYRIQLGNVKKGDLALVRLTPVLRRIVVERRYLPPGLPILKRVAAEAGDEICGFEEQIFVSGIALAVAKLEDTEGRKLPTWSGCKVLPDHEVLLLNSHPDSLDGRYFGATDRTLIVGKAIPVWTYEKDR